MQIKKGFIMREMAGKFVVVPVDSSEHGFSGVIQMNKTGAFLWRQLEQQNLQKEDLIAAMLETYDTTPEDAKRDVELFLARIDAAGILRQ